MIEIKNRWTRAVLFRSETEESLSVALREAVISSANLRGANLRGAYLRGAYLGGADLGEANLRGANLREAKLRQIRDDFWTVLSSVPAEVAGLRAAIVGGKVDGSTYTGECACLVGTLANVRHCDYQNLGSLKPDAQRPAERLFLAIRRGDTPETNQVSSIVLGWLDEWVAAVTAAFGKQETTT